MAGSAWMSRHQQKLNPGSMVLAMSTSPNKTSLIFGHENGISVYYVNAKKTLTRMRKSGCCQPILIGIVANTDSEIIFMVLKENPGEIVVYNMITSERVFSVKVTNEIRGVKTNKNFLVLCLIDEIQIYAKTSNQSYKHHWTIQGVARNPGGLLDISPQNILCYPASDESGILQFFNCENKGEMAKILAFDDVITAFTIHPDGKYVAVVCRQGTEIKVFSIENGTKICEFLRGFARAVDVACLAFSSCGEYLLTTSDTETVHVFEFKSNNRKGNGGSQEGWLSYFTSYLTTTVQKHLYNRAFATAKISRAGTKSMATLARIGDDIVLMVANQEGYIWFFDFCSIKGGEMVLERQLNFKTLELTHVSDNSENSDPDKEGLILKQFFPHSIFKK